MDNDDDKFRVNEEGGMRIRELGDDYESDDSDSDDKSQADPNDVQLEFGNNDPKRLDNNALDKRDGLPEAGK